MRHLRDLQNEKIASLEDSFAMTFSILGIAPTKFEYHID